MKNSNARRASSGFAFQTLIFFLATIGITAGATVAIVEAYQKWVIEPRAPSEAQKLKEENNRLQNKVKQLEQEARQSDENLWRKQMLEAAQVIRLTTGTKQADDNPADVTRGQRGLTADEIQMIDLKKAVLLVDNALQQDQSPLDSVFEKSTIDAWRHTSPTYKSNLNKQLESYKSEHPDRMDILKSRIDEAEHPERAAERR